MKIIERCLPASELPIEWQREGEFAPTFTSGKLLVSAETLAERDDVLHRPKLQRYVTARDAEGVLERLRARVRS